MSLCLEMSQLADEGHGSPVTSESQLPQSPSGLLQQTIFGVINVAKKMAEKRPLLQMTPSKSASFHWVQSSDEENKSLEGAPLSESRMLESHTTTNYQALMHVLRGNIGPGLLGLPLAVKKAGLLVGPIGLLIMGVIAASCMQIMVRICQFLCEKQGVSAMDYGEVFEEALRQGPVPFFRRNCRIGKIVANAFLIFTQLGVCCVYILFIAENIHQIYFYYYGEKVPSMNMFILMVFPLVMLYCCIRDLEGLAPFSALANIFLGVGLAITFGYMFSRVGKDIQPQDLPLYGSWRGLLIFFGTALFAFEGIGVVLPIENKMKNPEDFSFVLYLGMVIVYCLFITMGFVGYLTFGDTLEKTITLNLPEKGIFIVVRVLFVFIIYTSYGLQFYVSMQIIWPHLKEKISSSETQQLIAEYVFRCFLVLLTTTLAIAMPELPLFIALIGCSSGVALTIIFPPLLEEITFFYQGHSHWKIWLRMARNGLFLIIGLFGFVAGTIVSVQEIIAIF